MIAEMISVSIIAEQTSNVDTEPSCLTHEVWTKKRCNGQLDLIFGAKD